MLRNVYVPSTSCLSKAFATRGRWYPQPVILSIHERRTSGSFINIEGNSIVQSLDSMEIDEQNDTNVLPIFSTPRGPGHVTFGLVKWKFGELRADYILFEESMKISKLSWIAYDSLTTEEKSAYVEHMKAIHDRKLSYWCPQTKELFKTVSQLLFDGQCCGTGCRHCPYQLENCPDSIKKSLVWNGAFYV